MILVKKIGIKINNNDFFSSVFKPFFLILFLLMLLGNAAISATYYLTLAGAGNAQTAENWNTVATGRGTSATNFTTANDIFIIPSGINGIVSGAWAFGNSAIASSLTLTINGSLTINSGQIMTLLTNAGNLNMNVNGTLIFLGTTATMNQLAGVKGANGQGTITLSLNKNATIKTANLGGIGSATTGSINTAVTSLAFIADPSANYEFNAEGAGAQITLGMPAIVNNLSINNSSGVSLSSGVTVNGVLNFISGNLIPSSINTLTTGNTSSSAITGISSSSYINGPVNQSLAAQQLQLLILSGDPSKRAE
jgi:hypothetical protein